MGIWYRKKFLIMKSKIQKLSILFIFVTLFVGSALFMYFKFIHGQPKMRFDAPRTEIDPVKFDSALQAKYKKK